MVLAAPRRLQSELTHGSGLTSGFGCLCHRFVSSRSSDRRKQRANLATKARNHIFARKHVILMQAARRPVAAINRDRSRLGVNHPDQAHARLLVIFEFLVKLRGEVIRGDHLDGQVRRNPNEARWATHRPEGVLRG